MKYTKNKMTLSLTPFSLNLIGKFNKFINISSLNIALELFQNNANNKFDWVIKINK